MAKTYENRSAWLQTFFEQVINPYLVKRGYNIMDRFKGLVRINGAFPSKGSLGKTKRSYVEVWEPSDSRDHHAEVNISQTIDDPMLAAGLMAHAAIQLSVGKAVGAKREFQQAAAAAGMIPTNGRARLDRTDPNTGTTKRSETWTVTLPGPEFAAVIRAALTKFPPFPARAIDPAAIEAARDTNRQSILFLCPEAGCPVKFRTSRKAVGIDSEHPMARWIPWCPHESHTRPPRMLLKVAAPEAMPPAEEVQPEQQPAVEQQPEQPIEHPEAA